MKVTEVVEGVARMIYYTRASIDSREKTDQFIVGNNRLFDNGPPPFAPLPLAEQVLIEVSVGDTPIEVWKIARGLNFTDFTDEGQALIAIHAIFGHLVISEEYLALSNEDVKVDVVNYDPAFGPEWKATVFALAGPNSQTLSFECHTNMHWKLELWGQGNDHASAPVRDRPQSSAIPVVSSTGSGGHRGPTSSYDARQQHRGLGSVQSSISSTLNQLSPPLGPQPASLSSIRHGTSPTSFQAAFGGMTFSAQPTVPPSNALPIVAALKSISLLSSLQGVRLLPVLNSSEAQNEDDDFVATISTYDAVAHATPHVPLEEEGQDC